MRASRSAALFALSLPAILVLSSAAFADEAMDAVRSVDAPSKAPAWELSLPVGAAVHVQAPEKRVRHSSYRHRPTEDATRRG